MNTLSKPVFKAALRAAQGRVCRKVPRYSQTRAINLAALEVCPQGRTIVLSGTVEVTCGTPPDALVGGTISETVDFQGRFDLRECALQGLRVEPRGTFGKIIAAGLDLQGRLEGRLNRQLELFCR